MRRLFFLSGLPRSGSTLLGSIISQNKEIQATPTSPLSDFLCLIEEDLSLLDKNYTYNKDIIANNIYKTILNSFYLHIEKPYVLDKHRAWPRNINTLSRLLDYKPKIIATNRRISEVISSYISLIEKNKGEVNFVDKLILERGLEINLSNRIEILWREYVSDPYESLVYGLNNYRKNIYLVNYDDLVQNPQEELNKIYKFLELDEFIHEFDNIFNWCKEEKDSSWGMSGLHDIRPHLKKISRPPEEVIGEEYTKLLDKFNINK